MDQKLDSRSLELERRKHRSRLMYIAGIGCLALLVILVALVVIFFNLIVEVLSK